MQRTNIEWADYSANFLRAGAKGWSCVKVSPGCLNCYSETLNKRFGTGLDYSKRDNASTGHSVNEAELAKALKFKPRGPFKGGSKTPRVFLNDMTDMFGEWVTDEMLDRQFAAMAFRGDVIFQCLTKRAERMQRYMTGLGKSFARLKAACPVGYALEFNGISLVPWPLPNVWLGVSCEDQKRADERIPWLLKTPAAVRFISAEPLLGPVDLAEFLPHYPDGRCRHAKLGWVIVGGESGRGARACDLEWIEQIVDQCKASAVPCFVKQIGSRPVSGGEKPLLNSFGGSWHYKDRAVDKKGGNIAEWPTELRVREFPAPQAASEVSK